jgi:CRISPR/Cas system-associated endoribonuclease Cas2
VSPRWKRSDAEAASCGCKTLVAVVICYDIEARDRYLTERLETIDRILSYDVSIGTKRLKQAASLIAHGRSIHAG